MNSVRPAPTSGLRKRCPRFAGAPTRFSRVQFEFKSDLRREKDDAEEKLKRYLADREKAEGHRFVGIAADGASFIAYELRKNKLVQLGSEYRPSREDPRDLAAWLGQYVASTPQLRPEPHYIERQLGRESPTYGRARRDLEALWAEVGNRPAIVLKRDLWSRRLAIVYGSAIGDDALFLQHTYLILALDRTLPALKLPVVAIFCLTAWPRSANRRAVHLGLVSVWLEPRGTCNL